MKISIIGNGFDLAHNIKISFNEFVNSEVFLKNIGTYGKYFTNENYKNFCGETELWSRFEDYLGYICKSPNIKHNLFINKVGMIFDEWILSKKPSISYTKIDGDKFIDKITSSEIIVSLNYTDTLDMYGFEKRAFNSLSKPEEWDLSENKGMYINLHSYDEGLKSGKFVIGDDSNFKISKDKLISDWNDNKGFNIRTYIRKQFEIHKDKIQSIFIYGISLGDSDSSLRNFIEFISDHIEVIIFYYNVKPKIKNKKNIKFINVSI